MQKIRVRLAEPADDAGIAEVMSNVAMPGAIAMAYRYEPSFFSALTAEGYNPKAVVGEQAGKIIGAGAITTRNVYFQGAPLEVGYLASLRLIPELRGGSLIARGYRLFKELHRTQLKLPFYLTSIVRSNRRSREFLTSGKGGLPEYRFLAGYKTAILPVLRKYERERSVAVVSGAEAGIDAVFTCFEQYGSRKNYFTVHKREDWTNSTGMLKGMRPRDFLVAFSGTEPVGTAALWDQSSFKKLVVTDYSGSMRIARAASAFAEKLTGRTLLPAKHEPFGLVYLSCVAVRNNDPKIFRALLTEAVNRTRERNSSLLVAGFFENDQFWSIINVHWHLPFYSDIYVVSWDSSRAAGDTADTEKYLDAGSL